MPFLGKGAYVKDGGEWMYVDKDGEDITEHKSSIRYLYYEDFTRSIYKNNTAFDLDKTLQSTFVDLNSFYDDIIDTKNGFLAQFYNCSIAAALNVSHAENKILLLLDFKIFPILPMVVVLPTPLTPEISNILRPSILLKKSIFSKGFINLIMYFFKIIFTSFKVSLFGSIFSVEIISFMSEAASTPTSDSIK